MNEVLYLPLNSVIRSVFYYLFFFRILALKFNFKRDVLRIFMLMIIYTSFAILSVMFMIEPFRTIFSMILVVIYFVLITKEKLIKTFFVVFTSGLICIAVMNISLFISSNINFFILKIPDESYLVSNYISLFIQVVMNIILYFTIFKINISFVFHKDNDFGNPLVPAFTMMLFAYCSLRFLYQNELVLLNVFTWAMFVTGLIFLIVYIRTAIKKQDEKIALENEKHKLTERNDILRADNHKYADWLPGIDKKIDEKLSIIEDDAIRTAIKKGLSLNQIPELIQNRQSSLHKNIELPETGSLALDGYFAEQKMICLHKQIVFKAIVKARMDYITGQDIDILGVSRLVINTVSNSIKELEKTQMDKKEVIVYFQLNENKDYQISVFDNAHEFDLNILSNLGQRGNSTNGTGDGWADNFELLAQYHASLEIKEFEPYGGEFTKKISVTFDGKNDFTINSYRIEEILAAKNRK